MHPDNSKGLAPYGAKRRHPMLHSLKEIARALGGEVSNGQVLCPGPGHSQQDRSLAVKPRVNGNYIVHSFAGDDWRVCRDHVNARLGLPVWRSRP
jgi:putative DNA primase/helicase